MLWDEETGAGPLFPDQKTNNSYITKTKAALEKCYNLLEAFKLYNTELSERVGKEKGKNGTLKRYERLEWKIKVFLQKKYKQKDLVLNSLNKRYRKRFVLILLTTVM